VAARRSANAPNRGATELDSAGPVDTIRVLIHVGWSAAERRTYFWGVGRILGMSMAGKLATRFRAVARRLLRGRRPWEYRSVEARFEAIYRRNWWRDGESVSGPGSSLRETAAVRRELPGLIRRLGARSLLDIPCGDFHWLSRVELGVDRYVGADIVEAIVDANRRRFASPGRTFVKLDLMACPLPEVDLVLCRDCLVHFSLADIHRALRNIVRSGSRWLLTTTFTGEHEYREIATGQWHYLNLRRPPLELPEPLELLHEENLRPEFADKCLGLWRVTDLARATWAAQPSCGTGAAA
jgi:SAM-dependent methyltransferase